MRKDNIIELKKPETVDDLLSEVIRLEPVNSWRQP
jgi:hypothetical protein